jgi:hypothetical protein
MYACMRVGVRVRVDVCMNIHLSMYASACVRTTGSEGERGALKEGEYDS